jgi:hypothetical protein
MTELVVALYKTAHAAETVLGILDMQDPAAVTEAA